MRRLQIWRLVYARCLPIFVALTFVSQVLADNPGKFKSACEYQGDGGKYRWTVKIDPAPPPASVNAGHRLTPLQLYNWTGGRGAILSKTPRQGRETEWLQLTGKVTAVIVEGDGDVHIEISNADGSSQAKAGVEIPAAQRWCQMRKVVFGWTKPNFPFVTDRKKLTLVKHPIVAVIGKAFWDGQHAPKATGPGGLRRNRRTYDSHCAAWEVHPVMVLTVVHP